MEMSILVTGGARSGKSAFAERLVEAMPGDPVYIATAEARDDEMSARIAAHTARRGDRWTTLEAPLDLVAALQETDGRGPRLVDCLTLWLSNLMLGNARWDAAADSLAAALAAQTSPVVLVTNEVGLGIVPDTALGRAFRDAAGSLNHRIADAADTVYLVVAGQPMRVKPHA